jgi:invasion protein IalB
VRISLSPMIVALAGVLAMAQPALAQDTKGDAEAPDGATFGPRAGQKGQPAGQGPKTETIGTFGAWVVQCAELQGQDGKTAKSCGMAQSAKSDKEKNVGINTIVSRIKQGGKTVTLMRILAPIGVFLPTGVQMEIDGSALPNRMQFNRCLPQFCEAVGEASPQSLDKLKKGTSATFYIYARPGAGIPLKLSLEGFGKALAELDKLQ